MRFAAPLLAPLACVAIVAGCGNERQEGPDLTRVEQPSGTERVAFERPGMRFEAPANWRLREKEAPAVFTLSSGGAFVTGFAYRRSEPLPETDTELQAAVDRLIEEIDERDPGFDLESSDVTEVDGAPAIEVRGRQMISNRVLETRSVHVFRRSAEYVLEGLAPPDDFELVDGEVLAPLLRSLEVSGRVEREQEEEG